MRAGLSDQGDLRRVRPSREMGRVQSDQCRVRHQVAQHRGEEGSAARSGGVQGEGRQAPAPRSESSELASMLPRDTFKDQVAIVTGVGTGIGKVIAKTLGNLGAKVVIASRKQPVLTPGVAERGSSGIPVQAVPTDSRVPEQVAALIEGTLETFGRLDVLINNAAGNFIVPAEQLSANGFRTVLDIVLNGTFNCSRAAAKHWI